MFAGEVKQAGVISAQLKQTIERKANDAIVDIRPYARGLNTQLYLVDLSTGQRLIAKIAVSANAKLDLEGWMLEYLADNTNLPLPRVISAEKQMLLMSYLDDGGAIDAKTQRRAADMVAALHNIRGIRYGLDRDTMIGSLRQPNEQSKDWVEFFRDNRLLYMARKAWDEKKIDTTLMRNIEMLAGKLDSFIDKPVKPALIHGDLWSGNILVCRERISGFIDPAIYYADPEIELAFISLFGTFGDEFFKRYEESHPIREGFWDVRKDIYNLYPLLVHVRLYGASYLDKVRKIVKKFT